MARKISLVYSLALLATLCTLLSPVQANPGNQIANHARMIRKRVAEPSQGIPLLAPIGAGTDPNQAANPANPNPTDTDPAGGASPTGSGTPVGTGAGASQTSGGATQPTQNPGGLGNGLSLSLPNIGSPTGTPSASNSLPSANATLAQNSTSSLPSSTLPTSSLPSSTSSDSVAIATTTVPASEQQAAASATQTSGDTSGAASGSSGHLTRNTIIAIVVVAACVGGAIVIWTVIRKWKFAPSDEFGDRLNPIDWTPTGAEKEEKNTEGTGASHRRRGSGGSNRSFVSADAHRNNHNGSPNGTVNDLPAHDFTAGPAHLAPVGAYADLRRGASPTPSMGEQYYGRGYGATAGTQQYGHNGY